MPNRIPHLNKKQNCKFKNKSESIQKLLIDSLFMIEDFGIPLNDKTPRMKEKIAMNFLALADIQNTKNWKNTKDVNSHSMKTRDLIKYVNDNFHENRSSGSYDDIRRELKYLTLAGIVRNSLPDSATNDSRRGYGLDPNYAKVIRQYGTPYWEKNLKSILKEKNTLKNELDSRKSLKIPIKINDVESITLTTGIHNELQKKIVEDMLPRFCPKYEILYLGDTAKKQLINNMKKLESLNFFKLKHEMLPDIVAYSETKNWLYMIEAVYTSNPMTETRRLELSRMTKKCKAHIIYISAFMNKKDFRKFVNDIAWETEVWIADNCDHLIHFNGDKFLTPNN